MVHRPVETAYSRRMANFVCPNGHTWSAEVDAHGLVDGFGNPPCPECHENGVDADDSGDFKCQEGHTFRKYGNGGLTSGMVPLCPEHGVPADFA